MIYILDAYNVIHKIRLLGAALNKDLRSAREALEKLCYEWAQHRGDIAQIILIFDGRSEFQDLPRRNLGKIRCVFSETGESADERIVRVLEGLSKKSKRCIVSDDNFVRNQARAYQTPVLSVAQFETHLFKSRINRSRPDCGVSEIPAHIADQITQAYKKELGL